MTIIFNRQSDKEKRRQLRDNMPEAEVILWSRLQRKTLRGHKFRRQYGIGRYVVDFYCPKLKLAIEIDGDSHFTDQAQEYDREREAYIQSLGLKVIRFTNLEVRNNLCAVLEAIEKLVSPPYEGVAVAEGNGEVKEQPLRFRLMAKTPPLRKGRKYSGN